MLRPLRALRAVRQTRAAATLGVLVAAAGSCASGSSVRVELGPVAYTVNASRIEVPSGWRDTSGRTLRAIACEQPTNCPEFTLGDPPPAVSCIDRRCDPAAVSWSLASDVIDLGAHESLRGLSSNLTGVHIETGRFQVTAGGLRIPVGPTRVYWGPEAAPTIDSPGVYFLAEVPQVAAPDGATMDGALRLDEAGAASLGAHLVRVSRRFRLFARPSVDLAPSDPLPTGALVMRLWFDMSIDAAPPRS